MRVLIVLLVLAFHASGSKLSKSSLELGDVVLTGGSVLTVNSALYLTHQNYTEGAYLKIGPGGKVVAEASAPPTPPIPYIHYRLDVTNYPGLGATATGWCMVQFHLYGPDNSVYDLSSLTAEASNQYSEPYFPGNALVSDGEYCSKANSVSWWKISFTEAKSVTGYKIVKGGSDLNQNYPSEFTLQGSNDGFTYTILDSQSTGAWSSSIYEVTQLTPPP